MSTASASPFRNGLTLGAAIGVAPDHANHSFLTAASDDADPRPYLQEKHPGYFVFSDRGNFAVPSSVAKGMSDPDDPGEYDVPRCL